MQECVKKKKNPHMLVEKLYVYTCFLFICLLRIRKSSSVHSRLKLIRRKAPAQHKIARCRRELEPR